MTAPIRNGLPKRGSYSKKGCRQCKTRRIKCDEGKPACWQCSRLKKSCLYLDSHQEMDALIETSQRNFNIRKRRSESTNQTRSLRLTHGLWECRSMVRASREEKSENCESSSSVPPSGEISELSTAEMGLTENSSASEAQHKGLEVVEVGIKPVEAQRNHQALQQANLPLLGISHYDLNLLALDLDCIVNNMMEINQGGSLSEYSNMEDDVLFEEISSEQRRRLVSRGSVNGGIPRNLPFNYIPMNKNHESLYFEEFYNNFATIIQPFQSYDKEHGYYCTSRDIFLEVASKETFLLSAILSQGAKMSYEKHGLKEDEENSYKYLVKCLRLFEPALLRSRDDSNMVSNKIEGVLLTILLLTSSNASTLNLDWRSHLRGAKELLLKYSSHQGDNCKLTKSRVMVFCKHWFISFEILAGLSSKRGGTLRNDSEMDLIYTTNKKEMEILQEIGIVRPDGFNLLTGIHHSCSAPMKELIKLLNQRRGNGCIPETLHVFSLLGQFHEQLKTEFVKREGIVKLEYFRERELPECSLLDVINVRNGKLVISWMDISHQCYVLASMVILLRKGLQFSPINPHVQNLNKELFNLVSFLAENHELSIHSRCSMLLLQWPMLVAGLNCIHDEERLIAMKFFRNLANLGTASSTYALRKFNKVWKRPNNSEEKNDFLDSSSDVDVFTY